MFKFRLIAVAALCAVASLALAPEPAEARGKLFPLRPLFPRLHERREARAQQQAQQMMFVPAPAAPAAQPKAKAGEQAPIPKKAASTAGSSEQCTPECACGCQQGGPCTCASAGR